MDFKCFLKEEILTLQPVNTTILWANFICSYLSYSCLPAAWMHYGMLRLPQMYRYPQPACPDLCKNPVKSDNSLQYWHLLLCLLYFFFSVIFLPRLSTSLNPIQAGMISQRTVLLHWHGGSLQIVIAYGGRPLEIRIQHL